MSAGFQFVYPVYRAELAGILPGYEKFNPQIRTQNIVPGGVVGHIWSRVLQQFLCDEDLTRAQIAKDGNCKRVTSRDKALIGREVCPVCYERYLGVRARDPARLRAWENKQPLTVSGGHFD